MAQHKPGHPEFKFEVTIQYKTISSQTFQSDVKTLQCQLHEYVYLSYIINNSNVLKDFNTYLAGTDKTVCLFVDDKHLCVLLLENKSRSNINFKGLLNDFKKCIKEFGEKFLTFELLSPQYFEKTKEHVDTISIQYEQVTIGGKEKVAIVVAKSDEDKFTAAVQQTADNTTTKAADNGQTPDNTQGPDTAQSPDTVKAPDTEHASYNEQAFDNEHALNNKHEPDIEQTPDNQQKSDNQNETDNQQALHSEQTTHSEQSPEGEQASDNEQSPEDEQLPGDEQSPGDEKAPADEQSPGDKQAPEDEQSPDNQLAPGTAHSPDKANVPDSDQASLKAWELETGQIIRVFLGKPEVSGSEFVAEVGEGSRRLRKCDVKFDKRDSYMKVQVVLPKAGEKVPHRRLEESLRTLLKACADLDEFGSGNCVQLALEYEKSKSWELKTYLESILYALDSQRQLSTKDVVTVCTTDKTIFDTSCQYLNNRGRVIDIQVIKGSLEKTKADVLVCTVTEKLNLSFGATSHALAQAAGRKLQEDLNRNYPDGLVIRNKVAYASGYNLPCTEVYLMAVLPLNQAKADNNEIVHEEVRQNVETVMEATLLKATQNGYKSIAYPAIGTGMLKYPYDIVAQQMVESVEIFKKRYPDTKLEKVTFVIFKDDKIALDVFNKFVQKSVKAMPALKPIMYGNTDGTSEDVEKAKALMVTEMSQRLQSTSRMKSVSEASSISSRAINADSSKMSMRQKDTPLLPVSYISMKAINGTRRTCKMSGTLKNGQQSLITSITKKSSFEERVPIDKLQYKLLQHFYGPEFHTLHYIDGYAVISAENFTLLDKAKLGFTKKLSHVRKLQSSIHTPTKVSTSPEDGSQLCQKYCNDKTFCCYDKGVFHIYGILYEDVTSAKHQLEIDLGDLHIQREKNRCFQNASDLRSRKLSDSKETKPQLQFSWKSDTEKLKVFEVNKMYVKVYVGDILNVPVDAIVNAANENLKICVGIDNVILNAAGKKLDEECDKHVKTYGSFQTTDVFASSAGNLPYKLVLHAVGPKWINYHPLTMDNIKRCEKDLRYTINRCFITAEVKQLESVAFPAVSSAIFGCPVDLCAVQYARAIMAYRPCGHLKEIHFVDWNSQVVALVQKALECLQMKKDPDFYNRNAYVKTNSYPDLLSESSHETVTNVMPKFSKGTNRNTDGPSMMKPQTSSERTGRSRITARDPYNSSRSHGGTMYTIQSETDCVSGAKTEPKS